jgi:predicted amidohydrolase
VIDPARGADGVADVYLQDGKVAGVGRSLGSPDDALTIDAAGRWYRPD